MFEKIGKKRVLTLVVLVVLVGALAGAHYGILQPQQAKLEKDLRRLRGEISQRETETQQLRDDFDRLDEVKFRYGEVLRFGFLGEQDRVFAQNKIKEIKELSGVLKARYQFEPVEIVSAPDLAMSQHNLLSSAIQIELEAFSDLEIYRFLYYLNYGFPGQVVITDFELERDKNITVPLMQSIGAGQATSLVKAEIELDWYTIAPISAEQQDGGAL